MAKTGPRRRPAARSGERADGNGKAVSAQAHAETVVDLETALEELRTTQEELLANRMMLEEERAQYYELFELAPYGYMLTDRSGRIRKANQAVANLLGVPSQYIIDKPLIIFVEKSDRRRYWQLFDGLRNDGRAEGRLNLSPRHGPRIIAQVSVGTQPGRSSSSEAIRWTVQDVTEQVRADQELRRSREQLRQLAGEVARAEERERRRIAAGIHDRISQNLAMAKISLGRLSLDASPALKPAIEQISAVLSQAIRESRSLTFELAPPVLYELGLVPALEWLAEETNKQNGPVVRVEAVGKPPELPDDLRGLVFQAARELLTNTVKHANATHAKLSVACEKDSLQVSVSDDGSGFHHGPENAEDGRRGGFGLFNIRTRIEQIGGALQIHSARGVGTRSTIIIPLER